MRYKELRWSHLATVLQRLKWGDRAVEAAKVAGIPPGVWNRVRRAWDTLPAHLAEVDPLGVKCDLAYLNELVFEGRTKGGRPPGSLDAGSRASGKGSQPTLQVKDASIHVEGGMFYDE